jgi:hypothetical protein
VSRRALPGPSITLVLLVVLGAAPVYAQSVAKLDPRALALGGAYVAVADGWAALQWNPAGLWVSGRKEAAVSLGDVPFEAGPWIDALRVVAGFPGSADPADAASTLASADAGLASDRSAGVYFAATRWGGAFQQITYTGEMSRRRPDDWHLQQASLRTREYQISFAHPLLAGRLALGASAKLVQAQGRLQEVALATLSGAALDAGELLAQARGAPVIAERTVFAVDAGFLVMASARLRFGGVVKNINAPELDSGAQPSMRLPRQVRVGGLWLPHPDVRLSFDFDLLTDTFLSGLRERRELGGGLEWGDEVVALRGGLFVDLNAVEKRATYTFGLGVRGDAVRVDVGGSWAPERAAAFGWLGALAAEF